MSPALDPDMFEKYRKDLEKYRKAQKRRFDHPWDFECACAFQRRPIVEHQSSMKSSENLCIWPPTEKSREASVKSLIKVLSSSRYKPYHVPIPEGEASEIAKQMEEEAFTIAAAAHGGGDGNRVYLEEIRKRISEAIRSRSRSTTALAPPASGEAAAET